MTSSGKRALLRVGLAAVAAAALYLARYRSAPEGPAPESAPAVQERSAAPGPVANAAEAVDNAFRTHRSGVEIEAAGRVTRVLPDDREGARHQRFLVRIGGVSVLVAHNLDLAPRVPLAAGDSVELRGEYEWNAKGGVIHWTHRDPAGRHLPGWIRHRSQLYQ